MATTEDTRAANAAKDSSELAGFGYKQELDRSLGSFSSFAAGFSYISILTGVTALFGPATLNAGPGVWWTWPVIVCRAGLVALCFMEMRGQVSDRGLGLPVGQADRERVHRVDDGLDLHRRRDRDDHRRRDRLAGRAAPDHDQAPVLRQLGGCGRRSPRAGRRTRCCSGAVLIVITTIINMLGVKLMSRINNVGVLCRADRIDDSDHPLAFHLHQPPSVIVHSYGYGAGHPWGYFGALLIGGLSERLRDVRIRHGRDARRGDQQPPQARAAGDHPCGRGGVRHWWARDPAWDHVEQEHRRQEHRAARSSLRDQATHSATPPGTSSWSDARD